MGENKTMKSFFIGMFFCGEIRRPDYMVAQFYELLFFFFDSQEKTGDKGNRRK